MRVVFIIIAVFSITTSKASTFKIMSFDTTILQLKNNYKLNEADFLKTNGRDDSSKALIKYFFYKRKSSKEMIYIPLTAGFLITAGIGIASIFTPIAFNPGFVILLGLTGASILVLEIVGISRLLMVSRKRLSRILNNYFQVKSIPRRIVRSKAFNAFVHGAKTINRHKRPTHKQNFMFDMNN
jgi:hypothetical protein